jgi:hypothetical protein
MSQPDCQALLQWIYNEQLAIRKDVEAIKRKVGLLSRQQELERKSEQERQQRALRDRQGEAFLAEYLQARGGE